MNSAKFWAIVALVGAVLCWAGHYMVGGTAVAAMPIMSLMYVKWGASVIPLLVFAHFWERPDWKKLLKRSPKILILSCLGIAGYSFMLYKALSTTTAMNASLINAFNPALIVIGSAIFLKEKLTLPKVGGIVIAFLGVLWVMTSGHPAAVLDTHFNTGDLYMLAVVTCWAAYMVIYRMGDPLPPVATAALQMLFFTVLMTPYTLIHGITWPSTTLGAWSLAFIAIFPSGLAYSFWAIGAKVLEPSQSGQFLNLMAPFTAILSLLAGKSITNAEIIGGALILLGVYLTSREPATMPIQEEPSVTS